MYVNRAPGSTNNTGRLRRVGTFAEIEADFADRIRTMVYCSAATIDSHQRPRSRVLHTIWEGRTGWVTTEAKAAKVKQLAANPFISLAFIADAFKPLFLECRAVWQNDPATRQYVWDLSTNTGFDPAVSWEYVENPVYGVLRLDPWRIELYDLLNLRNRRVWYDEDESTAHSITSK